MSALCRALCGLALCGLALGGLVAVAGPGLPGARAAGSDEDAAQAAAESWLALLDRGRYERSWDEAQASFKAAMKRWQWKQAIDASRRPLGPLLSRRLQSRQSASRATGGPDGQYVILDFIVSFRNRASAVETVTTFLDEDGTWRVYAYAFE